MIAPPTKSPKKSQTRSISGTEEEESTLVEDSCRISRH